MRFFTTVPGETVPRIPAEIVDCLVDLPDCAPYNESDWYTVSIRLAGTVVFDDVPGGALGPISIVDDDAEPPKWTP